MFLLLSEGLNKIWGSFVFLFLTGTHKPQVQVGFYMLQKRFESKAPPGSCEKVTFKVKKRAISASPFFPSLLCFPVMSWFLTWYLRNFSSWTWSFSKTNIYQAWASFRRPVRVMLSSKWEIGTDVIAYPFRSFPYLSQLLHQSGNEPFMGLCSLSYDIGLRFKYELRPEILRPLSISTAGQSTSQLFFMLKIELWHLWSKASASEFWCTKLSFCKALHRIPKISECVFQSPRFQRQ